jgi:hypothetical protein
MGFAQRLREASTHEAAQKGPVTHSVATDVITAALKKAVVENGLIDLYPIDGVRLSSVLAQLNQTFNMAAFCQRFKMPPLIAGDLMQISLYDVQLFIDDSGSMNEGDKWNDARAIVTQIVQITTQFDLDGIDVEFLNSPVSGKRLKSVEDVSALFDQVWLSAAKFFDRCVFFLCISLCYCAHMFFKIFNHCTCVLSVCIIKSFSQFSGSTMWVYSSCINLRQKNSSSLF